MIFRLPPESTWEAVHVGVGNTGTNFLPSDSEGLDARPRPHLSIRPNPVLSKIRYQKKIYRQGRRIQGVLSYVQVDKYVLWYTCIRSYIWLHQRQPDPVPSCSSVKQKRPAFAPRSSLQGHSRMASVTSGAAERRIMRWNS